MGGSGGSGKSTLFKQLKSIHGAGFSKEDRMIFVDHIHAQIVEQMKLALDCLEQVAEEDLENKMGDDYERPDNFNAFSALSDDGQNAVMVLRAVKDPKLNDQIASACKTLWNEEAIKDIYEQRAIMKIEDTSNYFWDKIDGVMKSDFVPNETDMLLVRYRTTGVIEQTFTIKKNIFHVFDVGGQKSERKKWIHCFESVTAVIFVASMNCYDEVMFEDEEKNSMVDSIELFGNICNNEWFQDTAMILFLNKKDLFAEKIKQIPIVECEAFAHYQGPSDSFDQSADYIKSAFEQQNQQQSKQIFSHLTCAVDKNQVEKVFNDIQTIIINASLAQGGLIAA